MSRNSISKGGNNTLRSRIATNSDNEKKWLTMTQKTDNHKIFDNFLILRLTTGNSIVKKKRRTNVKFGQLKMHNDLLEITV